MLLNDDDGCFIFWAVVHPTVKTVIVLGIVFEHFVHKALQWFNGQGMWHGCVTSSSSSYCRFV